MTTRPSLRVMWVGGSSSSSDGAGDAAPADGASPSAGSSNRRGAFGSGAGSTAVGASGS